VSGQVRAPNRQRARPPSRGQAETLLQEISDQSFQEIELAAGIGNGLAPAVAARAAVAMVKGGTEAPCEALSAADRRSGTGAIPPAATRTFWSYAVGDDHARDDFRQRPYRVGAAYGAPVGRAFACQRERKFDCKDHLAWAQRLAHGGVDASQANRAVAIVEGCGATHGRRSNTTR